LTGQRTQYARHLLEFASAMMGCRGRVALDGLSMANSDDLGSRIAAILDRHRPVAQPLSRRRVAVIAGATCLVLPILAALQARPWIAAAASARPEAQQSPAPAGPPAGRGDDASQAKVVQGRVLDPDGRPFAGAMLFVPYETDLGDAFLSK